MESSRDPICIGCTLSHFLELKAELELLGSERNADLSEDGVDALYTRVRTALGLLVLNVASSVARGPPDVIGE
jgi:hypothetical protein